jgi:hypothetical protein
MGRPSLIFGLALNRCLILLLALAHDAAAQGERPRSPTESAKSADGPTWILRGKVIDETEKGVAGAEVGVQGGPSAEFFRAGPVVTNDDGRFELAGSLKTAEYLLKVVHAQRQLASASKIAVRPQQASTNVIDLPPTRLQRMGTVTGRVVIDGQPRAGVEVSANIQTELDGETVGYPLQSTKTAADGQYSLLATPHPTLNIVANTRDLKINTPMEQVGPRPLAPGGTLAMPAVQMTTLESFIAGIVVDPEGNPLTGIDVTAYTVESAAALAWSAGNASPTGADGRFRINGMPKATFRLMVFAPPPADAADRVIRYPARITVAAGQTDIRVVYDPKLKRTLPKEPRQPIESK